MKERKEDIEEELRELSPFLRGLKKESRPEGFATPPAYFRELPDRIFERIRQEEQTAPAGWWSRLALWLEPRRTWATALASLALLITAGLWWLSRAAEAEKTPEAALYSLSREEIRQYVEHNIRDFDEQWMLEFASTQTEINLLPTPGLGADEDSIDLYDEILKELDEEDFDDML